MSYRPYRSMTAIAAPYPALWRLAAGVVTAVAILALWAGAIVGIVSIWLDADMARAYRQLAGSGGRTPGRAVSLLLLVAGIGFGAYVAVRAWQGGRGRSLTGPAPRLLRHFVVAAVLGFGILAILAALSYAGGDRVGRNLPASIWLAWLPAAIIALLIQTGAEELFFRGYLQTQLAARWKTPLVWLVIPAIIFGALHYIPGLPGPNSWIIVGYAALFGVLAGDLTARTGSIGAAWGFHFANNFMGVAVISTQGSISGLGLWIQNEGLWAPIALSPVLALDVGALIAIWWVIRRVLTN